ncbi:MAG: thioredoxin fold domain-containing protein [Betaproteobacteria bacterium]|nr:thioredoxin fold domain-containing protein [Betaproteobacteria bacterium]
MDDPIHPPQEELEAGREQLLRRILIVSLIGLLLFALALFSGRFDAQAGEPRGKPADGFFPAAADLQSALAQAKRSGKAGVAVLFEASGCAECARLRATTLTDAGLRRYYRRHFVALSLLADEPTALRDFEGWITTQAGFARAERVMATPTLVFYDLEGVPVARQVGSALPTEEWLRLGRYVREAGYEQAPFSGWRPAEPRRFEKDEPVSVSKGVRP